MKSGDRVNDCQTLSLIQRATDKVIMSSTQNMMSGLPILANEIYLEIVPHIPSVPIPAETLLFLESWSYLEICHSRHKMLQSLSQVSHSFCGLFQCFYGSRLRSVREGRPP